MTQPRQSASEALRGAAGLTTQGNKQMSVPQMLSAYKSQIAAALPKHMSADRIARIALTAFNQTPALQKCTPTSFMAAVVISAQLGLEVGHLGQAYLIPYGTTCTFVPGWKGLVDLVNRSGRATVVTGAVYEGDEFDHDRGSANKITHKERWETEKLTHVYAIGRVRGAEMDVIEVWPVAKIAKHRDKHNKVGDRHYSYKYFEAYARKVVLLQVIKYMPVSVEMADAYHFEATADKGAQNLTMEALANNATTLPPLIEASPYDAEFDILDWSADERRAFLDEHAGKDEAAIKALLSSEIDKTQAGA